MKRTAKINAKTMSIKIDFKFFMWKKYFDLENVVSGQNPLVEWRKKNRGRGKVRRRGNGRRRSMMKEKGVERRITLGRRKEERIRRVGRINVIKEGGGRGLRRITCCRGSRRRGRYRLEKGGGGRRKAHGRGKVG